MTLLENVNSRPCVWSPNDLDKRNDNVCRHINRHLTAHESILHNEGTAHKGELKRRGNPVTGKVSGVSVIVSGSWQLFSELAQTSRLINAWKWIFLTSRKALPSSWSTLLRERSVDVLNLERYRGRGRLELWKDSSLHLSATLVSAC